MILSSLQIAKAMIRLYRCAGWSVTYLFANPSKTDFVVTRPIYCRFTTELWPLIEVQVLYNFFSDMRIDENIHISVWLV